MIPKTTSPPDTTISQEQSAYLHSHKQQKIFVKVCQLLILVCFLAVWELAVNLDWIDGFIFSSPSRICKTFYQMCVDGSFFLHLGTTLAEVFVSFTLIVVVGYGAAVHTHLIKGFADTGRTAKNKTVNPVKIHSKFPDS